MFARKHRLIFMEASAKSGENVDESFITLTMTVLQRIKEGVFNLNDEVRPLYLPIFPSGVY